jgi:hypothetical protein
MGTTTVKVILSPVPSFFFVRRSKSLNLDFSPIMLMGVCLWQLLALVGARSTTGAAGMRLGTGRVCLPAQ